MAAEKREITYNPTDVIAYIREHTPLTLSCLNEYLIQQWEHDQIAAGWVILDLIRLPVIMLGDWYNDEKHKVASPLIQLTPQAANGVSFPPRRVVLTPLPALSQLLQDVSNERLKGVRLLGMGPDDIINDTEGIRRSVIQALNAANPGELRQLSQDLNRLAEDQSGQENLPG